MRLTIAEVLRRAARRWPERTAVHVAGEEPLSYAALLDRATRFGAELHRRSPDARHVALLMPNSSRFLVALYGTALAGRTAVLLNPRLTDSELAYQVTQSRSDIVVAADAPNRPLGTLFPVLHAEGVSPDVVWDGGGGPTGAADLAEWTSGPASLDRRCRAGEGDTAVIIYTSGTTALPKGVMLAHASLVRNAHLVGSRFGASADDRVFSAGPFFHSGGLTLHLLMSALYGCAVHSVPVFDPDEVLDIVERERITVYNGIETLFLRLTDSPRFRPERLRSVRTGWATGTPAILHSIADDIGIPGVTGVYGISEASPNVTLSPWWDTREHRLDTVGRPQPWTEVQVCDPATGQRVGPGVPGEVLVRGYGVMQGYYGKPEETADALRDGWLHTGDLVVARHDGYLEFAGRMKDIVRVGGENVSCAEVENALYALGGVELAAVIPIDDPHRGQVPVAAVKLTADAESFSAEEMRQRLRAHLAGYKVPRHVVQVDSMPLTESGKIQKGQLRADIGHLVEGRP